MRSIRKWGLSDKILWRRLLQWWKIFSQLRAVCVSCDICEWQHLDVKKNPKNILLTTHLPIYLLEFFHRYWCRKGSQPGWGVGAALLSSTPLNLLCNLPSLYEKCCRNTLFVIPIESIVQQIQRIVAVFQDGTCYFFKLIKNGCVPKPSLSCFLFFFFLQAKKWTWLELSEFKN